MSRPGLLSSIGKISAPSTPSKPMPLILDEEGRTVDSSGRTVQLSVKHSTAKVGDHNYVVLASYPGSSQFFNDAHRKTREPGKIH